MKEQSTGHSHGAPWDCHSSGPSPGPGVLGQETPWVPGPPISLSLRGRMGQVESLLPAPASLGNLGHQFLKQNLGIKTVPASGGSCRINETI